MNRLPGGPTATSDRGISDLVGYVLTFSVLIASVALVSSVGFQQLEDMRTDEQLSNAERAFRLMERNLDEIQQSQAPIRSSEIDLHDGTILTNNSGAEAVVTIQRASGGPHVMTIPLNDIRYEVEDKVVAYESGSVFYSDEYSNDVLEDGPEMICTDDAAVLSFVTIRSETAQQFLTGGTVSVTASLKNTTLRYPMSRTGPDSVEDSQAVTVEFESRYDEAWNVYFGQRSEDWTQVSPPNPEFRCSDGDGDGVMHVYLRRTVIEVAIQR